MKIATFNVNDVRKRLGNLLAWLDEAEPDIVCLQELKTAQKDFPLAALESAGYRAAWVGQPTWNGVAVLSRLGSPVVTNTQLPGDPEDGQSRYLEAAVSGVLVACLYAPNGNPQPGPKFDYKLGWHKRLNRHAKQLLASGAPVVLAGDFNVAPTPEDVYATTSYVDNALVQPASRRLFAELVKQGWTDAVRAGFAEETVYTFWDYRRNRFERNAGLRLDHLLLTPDLASRLDEVGVDRHVRAAENASDHAPVWIRLRTQPRRR
ncbi:MAG: exodeoxyribonuclease III [Rhizobiaceae bacterium]|nr:exodeoxyribonuclease III [Rhizobiaceae bacterium]